MPIAPLSVAQLMSSLSCIARCDRRALSPPLWRATQQDTQRLGEAPGVTVFSLIRAPIDGAEHALRKNLPFTLERRLGPQELGGPLQFSCPGSQNYPDPPFYPKGGKQARPSRAFGSVTAGVSALWSTCLMSLGQQHTQRLCSVVRVNWSHGNVLSWKWKPSGSPPSP